jgi:hypothetical protein
MDRLGLSFKKATKDPGSLPHNWQDLKRRFLVRFTWVVWKFNILPEFCFNLDETSLCFLPTATKTWSTKGGKSVPVVASSEKRAFTLTPIVNACGFLVGKVQVIWGGKTEKCEPAADLKRQHEDFIDHTHTESHWARPHTVLDFVRKFYHHHVKPSMIAKGCDVDSTYWVLLWDVHCTHRDEEVLSTLKAEIPNLIILFIPANLTSVCQPLDLSFNQPFKGIIKRAAAKWMIKQVGGQVSQGCQGEEVSIPLSKKVLTPFFCEWIVEAVTWGRDDVSLDVIKSGWQKAGLLTAWDPVQKSSLLLEGQRLAAENKLWVMTNNKEVPVVPDCKVGWEAEDDLKHNDDNEDEDLVEDTRNEDELNENPDEEERSTHPDEEFLKHLKGVSAGGRLWFAPKRT